MTRPRTVDTSLLRIAVFGSGQIGGMVQSILAEGPYQIVGYVDDDPASDFAHGHPILGDRSWLTSNRNSYDAVCLGVGTIAARKLLSGWLASESVPSVSAIHSSAIISPDVELGENLIIGAGTTLFVNPKIGDGTFIGPSVVVSHDTIIGNHCLLSVGSVIGARCDIGDEVLVGCGARLMPTGFSTKARLHIGNRATVGVGATVIRNVSVDSTVVGTPAKPIANK